MLLELFLHTGVNRLLKQNTPVHVGIYHLTTFDEQLSCKNMYRSTSITLLLGSSLYRPTAYLTASLLVDTYCFWRITVTNNANTSFYTDFCAHVLVTINLAALNNGNVLTTEMYCLIAGEPRRSKSGCQQAGSSEGSEGKPSLYPLSASGGHSALLMLFTTWTHPWVLRLSSPGLSFLSEGHQ